MAAPRNDGFDDPRVYLAVERTFLSWIRTGLALMGFGFVVARFGILMQELRLSNVLTDKAPAPGLAALFGTALVLLGVALTSASILRYVQLLRRLERGEKLSRPSRSALAVASALVLIGLAASVYLLIRM